jgi:agmatinase/guanidinopropionase
VGGSYSEALGVETTELSAADGGDIVTAELSTAALLDKVADHVADVVKTGSVAALVGGDGTLTLGALRGIRRAKRRSVGLLHIDAFHDLVPVAAGGDITERSVLSAALEEELLRPENVFSIGVRGPVPSASEQRAALRSGFEVVSLDDVRWDVHAAVSQVRNLARRGSLYVSVDLCALDPSVAPGVSTPAPGGMTTWELQQILRSLVGADIVGFDVVGLVPGYDVSELSASVGVIALRELLAAIADTRRSGAPDSAPPRGRSGRRSA